MKVLFLQGVRSRFVCSTSHNCCAAPPSAARSGGGEAFQSRRGKTLRGAGLKCQVQRRFGELELEHARCPGLIPNQIDASVEQRTKAKSRHHPFSHRKLICPG